MDPETSFAEAGAHTRGRRSTAAAWVSTAVLLGVCAFHWDGFVYSQYSGAVVSQTGTLVLLLIWAWPRGWEKSRRQKLSLAAVLLAGYAAFSALSPLWAPHGRLAAIGSIPVLFWATWALILGKLLRDRKAMRIVLEAIFLAGTVAALAGLYYVLGGYALPEIRQVQGQHSFLTIINRMLARIEMVHGHRNFLAIFLLPPVLLGVADLFSPVLQPGARRGRILQLPAYLLVPCLGVMGVALLACKSIGGLLGLFIGCACLACLRLSRRRRLLLIGIFAALAVAGLVLLSRPFVTEWLLTSHGAQATRWFMWQGALRMILERPVFGWGTGMFLPHFADYKPTLPMAYGLLRDLTLYPHNEVLTVAAEGGLIALALYLGGLLFAVRAHLRAAETEDTERRIVGWAVFAGFLAMFAQGLVSVALRYWAPCALYWTLVGLMLAFSKIEAEPSPKDPARVGQQAGTFRFIGVLVVVVVLAWGVVRSGAQAEMLMRHFVERSKAGPQQQIEYYAQAARLSRYVPDHLVALRRRAKILAALGEYDDAIAAYEELNGKAPGYGPVRKYLGRLYSARAVRRDPQSEQGKADFERAVDVLNRAVKQNPYDAEARVLLAHALNLSPDEHLSTAIEHVRAAVEAEPDNPRVHYELARFLAKAGETREALGALDRAQPLCDEEQQGLKMRIGRLREELLKEAKPGGDSG